MGIAAGVEADIKDGGIENFTDKLSKMATPRTVQGGAVFTMPFAPSVASVQVLLKTDPKDLSSPFLRHQEPETLFVLLTRQLLNSLLDATSNPSLFRQEATICSL